MMRLLTILLLIVGCVSKTSLYKEEYLSESKRVTYNKNFYKKYGYLPNKYGNNADWQSEIFIENNIIIDVIIEDNRDFEKSIKD